MKAAIEKAIRFAANFVHPDGSFGGEYTSRNTYNFFPHGFEIAGKWLPEALEINGRFLAGLEKGLGPCYADDHILGHHAWSYLLAWRDFVPERPAPQSRTAGRHYFRNAGIVIDRRDGAELYLALNKGGVFKLFREGKLVCSDTQFSARVREGGKVRTAVAHLTGDYEIHFSQDSISVSGDLGWAKGKQMTPFNLIALRLLMLSVGRFNPDLVRKALLQKLLITGKKPAKPLQFMRRIVWSDGQAKNQRRAAADASVGQSGGGGPQRIANFGSM